VDPSVSGPGVTGHWGYNNFTKNPDSNGTDFCAVANWRMRYGTPSTWGYNDVGCNEQHQVLCKVRSEMEEGLCWNAPHLQSAGLPGAPNTGSAVSARFGG
jgi:hypothetical protein